MAKRRAAASTAARFWDTSAIVPLVVEETTSRSARALYRQNARIVTWEYTVVEAASALSRLERTGELDEAGRAEALRRLDQLAAHWEEVVARDDASANDLKERARDLMGRHPLRSGDALQLASAMIYFDPPNQRGFVVGDGTLGDAADAEGFTVHRLTA